MRRFRFLPPDGDEIRMANMRRSAIAHLLLISNLYTTSAVNANEPPTPGDVYRAKLVRIIEDHRILLDIDLGFGVWKRDQILSLRPNQGEAGEVSKSEKDREEKALTLLSATENLTVRITPENDGHTAGTVTSIWANGKDVTKDIAILSASRRSDKSFTTRIRRVLSNGLDQIEQNRDTPGALLFADLVKIAFGLIFAFPGTLIAMITAIVALLTYKQSVKSKRGDVILQLQQEYTKHHDVFLDLEDSSMTESYSHAIHFSMFSVLHLLPHLKLCDAASDAEIQTARKESKRIATSVKRFRKQAPNIHEHLERVNKLEAALRFLYIAERLSILSIQGRIVENLVGYSLSCIVDLNERNNFSCTSLCPKEDLSDRRAIEAYVKAYWPSLIQWKQRIDRGRAKRNSGSLAGFSKFTERFFAKSDFKALFSRLTPYGRLSGSVRPDLRSDKPARLATGISRSSKTLSDHPDSIHGSPEKKNSPLRSGPGPNRKEGQATLPDKTARIELMEITLEWLNSKTKACPHNP